ncbi:MAG: SGNH/GDSL hydrolase family protein [Verrucomicrobiota bacterium JB024]|nr:SGNH/GDSL hydrolase family protein [Verrucomicrobiota bacterium JB024]
MKHHFHFNRIWPFALLLLSISGFSAPSFGASHSETDAYPLRDAIEFTPRDGLPNIFRKLDDGDEVSIAYFGGSITEQGGWRLQSLAWFREEYPDATVKQINAALGGTGSSLGVFRLEGDVIEHHPDLIFVEFAVNDSGVKPDEIIKAMEGIVRKIWQASNTTDICFVYTMTKSESRQLAAGKLQRSASVMEAVADHYGIPSICLGLEAADMEAAGKLIMKTDAPMTRVSGDELNEAAMMATDEQGRIIFSKDGVHPYPETGHVLYTQALVRSMEQSQYDADTLAHPLPDPIDPDNWVMAQQLTITEAMLSGPWEILSPENDQLAKQFNRRMHPIYRLQPGAELTFRFKGSKVAVYDLMGPTGAVVEVTRDGKTWKSKRMDAYCTYYRLATMDIGRNLDPDTVHEVVIRVLDEPVDRKQTLFEKNRKDVDKNPQKYEGSFFYPGGILIVGELVE